MLITRPIYINANDTVVLFSQKYNQVLNEPRLTICRCNAVFQLITFKQIVVRLTNRFG